MSFLRQLPYTYEMVVVTCAMGGNISIQTGRLSTEAKTRVKDITKHFIRLHCDDLDSLMWRPSREDPDSKLLLLWDVECGHNHCDGFDQLLANDAFATDKGGEFIAKVIRK